MGLEETAKPKHQYTQYTDEYLDMLDEIIDGYEECTEGVK